MARSPAQSDFDVEPKPGAEIDVAVEASSRATRWVLGLTVFLLIALGLLLMIGPHIPAGE